MTRRKTHRGELRIPQPQIETFLRDFPNGFDTANMQLVFVLRALAQRINDRSTLWLSEFDLTAPQFNYLAAVYSHGERGITVTDLMSLLHTSNGSVVIMLNLLEKASLIRRLPNPADARSTIVHLTPLGRRLFKRSFLAYHRYVSLALAGIGGVEKKSLLELLLRIGEALSDAPN